MTYQNNKIIILVFKTNINRKNDLKKLKSVFNRPEIVRWNVNLDDCDKVLRVVLNQHSGYDIITETKKKRFICEELK